ncbi:hypothetical protein FWH09_01880 [Candidatus Saccharibacteria bacterium]|nr:hypothetical protein [Candidatus Saccharibacteria bacterium]
MIDFFKVSKLVLHKENGESMEFNGYAQPHLIITSNTKLPFEIGDIIGRTIESNGIVERYVITDPQYYDREALIGNGGTQIGEGHFQIKIKKEDVLKSTPKSNQSIVFNGTTNFHDKTNIANTINVNYSYINELKDVDDDFKQEIIALLEEAKEKKNQPKVAKFIIERVLSLGENIAGNVLAAIIMSGSKME